MLVSIYHMTLRLLCYLISRVKNVIILSLCTQCCYGRHNVSLKIDKTLVVYRFYCMALFHSQTQRHITNGYLKGKIFSLRKSTDPPFNCAVYHFYQNKEHENSHPVF